MRLDGVPAPQPGPGEALLEVKAASVNHLDLFVRRGMPGITLPLPMICGSDAAGAVAALGEGTTGPPIGTRVLVYPGRYCGRCRHCESGNQSMCAHYRILGEHMDGTYAEQIALPAHLLIPFPDDWTFEQAASVPLVFLTAWRMVIRRGRLRAGETVLVLGAGSGVGSACIQIARAAGAHVWAAASSDEKLLKAKALGADVLINYKKEPFDKQIRSLTGKRGVDVVVDYVGKDTWQQSLRALCNGGRLLTCGATTGFDPQEDLRQIFFRQLEVIGSTMGSQTDLLEVLDLLFSGRLHPVVDSVLPLEQAATAHRLIEGREVFGKVVLSVGL